MHEIDLLEKRWRKYRLKKLSLPLSILGLCVAVAIFFITVYFINTNSKANSYTVDVQDRFEQEADIDAKIDTLLSDTQTATDTKEEKVQQPQQQSRTKLRSYEPEIAMPQQQRQNIQEQKDKESKDKEPKSEKTASKKQESQKSEQPLQKEQESSEKKESSLQFSRSESQINTEEIKKRYQESKNPRHALFLANYFYDSAQYQKSSRWAYELNQNDPSIEEGWLIFAKSLYMLQRQEDAISILRSYRRHYDSTKADELLRQFIQGEF